MNHVGPKSLICWRSLALCASALLVFAAPRVCLAEDAAAADGAALVATVEQASTDPAQSALPTATELADTQVEATEAEAAAPEGAATDAPAPIGAASPDVIVPGDAATGAADASAAPVDPSKQNAPAGGETAEPADGQGASGGDAITDAAADDADAGDQPLSGEVCVDGRWYYYDELGRPVTGWRTWSDGTRSYFGSGGAALSGFRSFGGKTYYFDPDNRCHSARHTRTIKGKMYYFSKAGVMHTGWLTWKADGTRSYFEPTRTSAKYSYGAAHTGLDAVGGKTYYFDPARSNHSARYRRTIGGKLYYFSRAGVMQTGWLTWKADGTRSYFGKSGAALSRWRNDGSRRYYISPSTLKTVRYCQTIGGKLYYFSRAGVMQTGWVTWKADGTRSYFEPSKSSEACPYGAAHTGFDTIDGKTYYFDAANSCHNSRYTKNIEGKMYYFSKAGVMYTGWLTWKKDQSRSLFGTDGAALCGWQEDDDGSYYIDKKTFHTVRYRRAIDGKRYYFYSNYALATRRWFQFKGDSAPTWSDSEGVLTQAAGMALNSSGKITGAKPGWLSLGSDRFYIKPDGTARTGWMSLGGKRYWLDADTGVAAEGVAQVGKAYYYFSHKTQERQTGWKTEGTHRYYFDPKTGKAATGIVEVNGKTRYFDANGWEITADQFKVLQSAKKTPSPGAGLCSEWISWVFERAGIASFGGDARDQYAWYCKSSDRDDLRVGMIVAVSRHSHTVLGRIYGHVCLYIGNGKIMDNIGYIRTMDLDPWLDHYGDLVTPKWGWAGNRALA